MNVVCLNCEAVVRTNDPRVKFCGKVCRNRWNVKKTRSKPKKEKVGIESLREMIRRIESKPKLVKASIVQQTYQKDEWVDPI